MLSKSIKIVVSGGGTGGHIFPALAIADAVRSRIPKAVILFVGAKGRMEMERVPKAGYPIEGLWISGFQRKLSIENLNFPFKLIHSLLKARKILKRFKPDLVIGVGGYASGPTLRSAVQLGIPTLIQEQNSFPGVTNKIIGKKADCICVAYNAMDQWFPKEKIVLTGNPLRLNAVQTEGKKEEACKFFNLDSQKPIVLIVGGSQGALGINKGLSAQLDKLKNSDIQMLWQTGKTYHEIATKQIQELGLKNRLKAIPFIDRMDLAYAMADLVVSRAGAMAISEMAVVGKAVIFVPLPTAAEDHQTKNAMRLVDAEAAVLVKNIEASEKLIPEMLQLIENKEQRERMANYIKKFALPDAAEKIVDEIVKLLEK